MVEALHETAECDTLDPRIRRSRQMLHDALAELLGRKKFEKISIQEIAQLSTLNRATFYSHYPDKFVLLQCMVGSRFHTLMAKRSVRFDDCSGALRALGLGVCDFLVEMPGVDRGGNGQVEGSIQTAIVAVVENLVLEGIRSHNLTRPVSVRLLASTLAWAIYGAAYTWVRTPERCPAEEMAVVIEGLVSPMMHAAISPHHP